MSVFILLFNIKEQPIAEQLQHPEFWVKTLVYLIVGIFGLGYYNWKHKQKQQSK
jgi:hypothetical protein